MKQPEKRMAGVEFDDRDGAFQDTVEIKSQDAQPKQQCIVSSATTRAGVLP